MIIKLALKNAILPGTAVGMTFIAIGIQMFESGFNVWQVLLANLSIYAMPALLSMIDSLDRNYSLITLALLVLLSNSRMIPMVMAMMPYCLSKKSWQNYLMIHFVALTAWLVFLDNQSQIPKQQRPQYFLIFGGSVWLFCILCGQIGYLIAPWIPQEYITSIMLINPIYLSLLLLQRWKVDKNAFYAVIISGACLPLMYQFSDKYSILICGILIGSSVFLYETLKKNQKTSKA